MFHRRYFRLAIVFLALLPGSSSLASQIPLLGGSSDSIVLARTLPPTIDLANKRIALEINTTSGIPPQNLGALKTRLETGIQADKRFIIDAANPATLVRLTATRLAVTRSKTQLLIKGNQTDVTRVDGELRVSFQAIDAVSKQPLDSSEIHSVLQKNYYELRRGPLPNISTQASRILQQQMSDQEAFDLLLSNVTAQITRRMAQTQEAIKVGRPDNELKKFRDKAESRQWVSLYDDLTDMKPLKDDDDKAERAYWMGVAKEATAYEMKVPAQARESLVVAARHYDEAFKLKPNESTYLESKNRAEESTVLLAGATPNGGSGDSNTRSVPPPNSKDEIMTNDVVIFLLDSKMTPDTLIGIIKDPSTKTQFDVGFAALGRLSSSKVPDSVIQAMRDRAKNQ